MIDDPHPAPRPEDDAAPEETRPAQRTGGQGFDANDFWGSDWPNKTLMSMAPAAEEKAPEGLPDAVPDTTLAADDAPLAQEPTLPEAEAFGSAVDFPETGGSMPGAQAAAADAEAQDDASPAEPQLDIAPMRHELEAGEAMAGVLALHRVWLQSAGKEGRRAVLRGQPLDGMNLRAQDLRQANFRSVKIDGADFAGASLGEADFSEAELSNCNFTSADGRQAGFARARFTRCRFDYAQLGQVNGHQLRLEDCHFTQANLERANLRAGQVQGCDFAQGNLTGCNLRGSDISASQFAGANLSHADFREASLRDVRFDGAMLQRAQFRDARLEQVDLAAADFSEASDMPQAQPEPLPTEPQAVDGQPSAMEKPPFAAREEFAFAESPEIPETSETTQTTRIAPEMEDTQRLRAALAEIAALSEPFAGWARSFRIFGAVWLVLSLAFAGFLLLALLEYGLDQVDWIATLFIIGAALILAVTGFRAGLRAGGIARRLRQAIVMAAPPAEDPQEPIAGTPHEDSTGLMHD